MSCPGRFTPYRDVNCKDLVIFHEATKYLRGVTYKPYLVSYQVVCGVRYQFICNTTIMTRPPKNVITRVSIYKPLCRDRDKERCNAFVTNICQMDCYRSS